MKKDNLSFKDIHGKPVDTTLAFTAEVLRYLLLFVTFPIRVLLYWLNPFDGKKIKIQK
jgi:hypothetical protein